MNKPDSRKRRTMNDIVYTNPVFAKRIVDYFSPQFKPNDKFYEPCLGAGGFYDAMPEPKDYSEIAEGKDFLTYDKPIDWIITNLPWSSKIYRPLYRHACKLSNNVVQLIRMHNWAGTTARHNDYLEQGHGVKEIILCSWDGVFFNKSNEGFSLIVVHTQKNYTGDCKFTYWYRK